jgi:hypothetical protein
MRRPAWLLFLSLLPLAACENQAATRPTIESPSCQAAVTHLLSAGPPPREDAGMTYDAARQNVVLFGGDRDATTTLLSDTWTWDGLSWTEHHPITSPSPRSRMAMTYDEAHNLVVLFGGTDRYLTVPGSTNRSDTWTWDGMTWTEQHPSVAPTLGEAAMTFDEARRVTVLFGHRPQGGAPETWVWDGARWQQKHPTRSPSGRLGASLAYNWKTYDVVLFGGFNQQEGELSDTWTWDGENWSQAHPQNNPPVRFGATLGGGPVGLLMFGGSRAQGQRYGDTWMWNGADWLPLEPCSSPSPRSGASAAYDIRRSQLVMFGGGLAAGAPAPYGRDTWTWDGASWRLAR